MPRSLAGAHTEVQLRASRSAADGVGVINYLFNKIGLKKELPIKNCPDWASLVVQWLRICLPMQGTWVRALVWEDPTCRRATGPVSHNC